MNKFAEWSTAMVNTFPDSSFAFIMQGGKKDSEGKTVPRSLRKLPYKDANGNIDLAHVRNALARLDQTDGISDSKINSIRTMLQNILKKQNMSDQRLKAQVAYENKGIVKGLEVMRVGKWNNTDITEKHLKNWENTFKKMYEENSYMPPIHIGHNNYSDDTKPADGLINNLYVVGKSIYADIVGIVDDFLDKIRPYPYRSVEVNDNRLFSVALLGATTAAVPFEPLLFNHSDKIFISFFNFNYMSFETYLNEIKQQEKIEFADVAVLKKLFNRLSEEEQSKFQEEVDAITPTEEVKEETIEEKIEEVKEDVVEIVEDVKEAVADVADVAEAIVEEVKDTVEEVIEEVKEEITEETKEEVVEEKQEFKANQEEIMSFKEQIAKLQSMNDKLMSEKTFALCKEEVNKFALSDTVKAGFNAEGMEKATKFASKLSNELRNEFFGLLPCIKFVDTSVAGVEASPEMTEEDERIKAVEEKLASKK